MKIESHHVLVLVMAGCGLAAGVTVVSPTTQPHVVPVEASVRPVRVDVLAVRFSPSGGCTEELCRRIDAAKSEVLVLAYCFSNKQIAAAILRAKKRDLFVEVVLDERENDGLEPGLMGRPLATAGVPVFFDGKHAIAHNKVVVIDQEIVCTGSFNFTAAAEMRNAENLVVLKGKDLAAVYRENWQLHRAHATPLKK